MKKINQNRFELSKIRLNKLRNLQTAGIKCRPDADFYLQQVYETLPPPCCEPCDLYEKNIDYCNQCNQCDHCSTPNTHNSNCSDHNDQPVCQPHPHHQPIVLNVTPAPCGNQTSTSTCNIPINRPVDNITIPVTVNVTTNCDQSDNNGPTDPVNQITDRLYFELYDKIYSGIYQNILQNYILQPVITLPPAAPTPAPPTAPPNSTASILANAYANRLKPCFDHDTSSFFDEMSPDRESHEPIIYDGTTYNYSFCMDKCYGLYNQIHPIHLKKVSFDHIKKHFTPEDFYFVDFFDASVRPFEIMNAKNLKTNKSIKITQESDIYISVYREAAGYDNSIGYYFYKKDMDLPNVKKTILFPTIKNIVGHQHYLGRVSDVEFGMFLVPDGNLKYNFEGDLTNPKPKYIHYTHYEFNDDVIAPDEYKFRHLFIEEPKNRTCTCSGHIRHYIITFEDLSEAFVDMAGNLLPEAVISFDNVVFIITVMQLDGLPNTSVLF